MKTNTNKNQKKQNTGLLSRPEQLGTAGTTERKTNLAYINFRERETNRYLSVSYIMASLARWMPIQHSLAKVAGSVITIHFEQAPIQRVRQELSEFGFSWSRKRNAWQHYGGRVNA